MASLPRFAGLAVLLVAASAYGAVYDVDRTDDTASATACTAAANDCSLRGAVLTANAHAGADTVNVPAGTYGLSVLGAAEDAAASGDLDILGDLVVQGAGAATTVIDGNGIDRIFHTDPTGAGITVEIKDLTVQNGATTLISFVLANGGAIRNGTPFTAAANTGGTLTLSDCVVKGSATPRDGGGIASVGSLTLLRTVVTGNSGSNGGGIAQEDGGSLTITDSTVSDNQASQGGGLFTGYFSITANPLVTITGSTISGNRAAGSGGIFYNRGSIALVNSTVSGNQSAGIGIFGGFGTATLRSCTITGNGYYGVSGNATVSNTLIAGNNGGNGDCSGTLTSTGYNLIQNAAGCTVGGSQTGNVIGQDPQLAALTDNGGPTRTHAIAQGSPALDAASPNVPGSGGFACEATDQRGTARPQPTSGRCDIGAFELVYAPPTTTTTTTTTVVPPTTTSTTSGGSSTTSVVPTTTSSTIGAPPTTTLPIGPCGGIPLVPPGFASIECRLAALLAEVNGASGLGTYQAKLSKSIGQARTRVADGSNLCGQSNLKKAKKRLQQAAKAAAKMVRALNTPAAKRRLDGPLRQSLVDDGTAARDDLKAFRSAVVCP